MAKKSIDLDRVRWANARLDQLVKDHPELIGETSKADWLNIIENVLMTQDSYSVEAAADVLNVDIETLRGAIKAGKLRATIAGRGFQISRQDLIDFHRAQGGGKLPENE